MVIWWPKFLQSMYVGMKLVNQRMSHDKIRPQCFPNWFQQVTFPPEIYEILVSAAFVFADIGFSNMLTEKLHVIAV